MQRSPTNNIRSTDTERRQNPFQTTFTCHKYVYGNSCRRKVSTLRYAARTWCTEFEFRLASYACSFKIVLHLLTREQQILEIGCEIVHIPLKDSWFDVQHP